MSYCRTINCTKYDNNSNTLDRGPSPSIQLHTNDWKLSSSLEEVLPHLSTWGVAHLFWILYGTYCFWEDTCRTLHPSTCFVRSLQIAFNSQILFLLTSFCLSVKTFLICYLISAISLLIFKISRSTSLWEGILHLCMLKTSKEVTRQGVIFNPPKP